MKQTIYTIVFLLAAHIAASQNSVRYYKSAKMKHETSQKKARYAYNVSDDAGVITHTLSDMKGNVIWKEIYKNQEPVGIWQTESGVQLDYNFELKYYSESTDSAAYKLLTLL